MNLKIHPRHPLSGEIIPPGDKSISHRAALLAAAAHGESRVEHFLDSGVTRAMLNALTQLGVCWHIGENNTLVMNGGGFAALRPPTEPLFCGNSATTLRLLAGLIAAADIPAVLDGSAGLRRRPMDRIVEPLQQMGVSISAAAGGVAPLTITQRPPRMPLQGGTYRLQVASAQVKSCLLLAGLAAREPVTIIEPAPSRDHTERMLRGLGIEVTTFEVEGLPAVTLNPPVHLQFPPLQLSIPADFSAAAFLLAAGAITPGSQITLRGVGINPTRTGFLSALQQMGADLTLHNQSLLYDEPVADLTIRSSTLRGINLSGRQVVWMIDEFPIFAVTAAFAQGITMVCDAAELRYKESDRIRAVCTMINTLGGEAYETPDGFIIHGTGGLKGGAAIHTSGDHRLGMSAMVAGLAASQPCTIFDAEIVAESYPAFTEVLISLGAEITREFNEETI